MLFLFISIAIILLLLGCFPNNRINDNIYYCQPGDFLYYNKSIEKDLGITIVRIDYPSFHNNRYGEI